MENNANRPGLKLLQWTSVAVFLGTLALGLLTPQTSELWVRSLFWSLFWPVLTVFVLLLAGPLFCALCPLGVMGRFISRHGLKWRLPNALGWSGLSALMLLLSYWLVNTVTPGYGRLPLVFTLAFFGGYLLLMAVLSLLYRDAPFCRSLCPFAILTRIFAGHGYVRLGHVSRGTVQQSESEQGCRDCRKSDCARQCPQKLSPARLASQSAESPAADSAAREARCNLCLACYRQCDRLRLQPGKRRVQPSLSMTSALTLLILTALVVIESQLAHRWDRTAWRELMPWHTLDSWLSGLSLPWLASRSLALALCSLLLTLLLAVCCALAAAALSRRPWRELLPAMAAVNTPLLLCLLLSHGLMMLAMRGITQLSQGLGQLFGLDWALPALARDSALMPVLGLLVWLGVLWSLARAWQWAVSLSRRALTRIGLWLLASALVWLFVGLRWGGMLLAAQAASCH
ncbi:4Fe-4S binding protein [Shewanella sp. GXUN23E]|uniref:4Fe-4S binding protein n=1 Tax=Shewanella sp. GXUN23E TaxID=3422498 RepID=UPI003D7EC28D